jgi:hypothetical protein
VVVQAKGDLDRKLTSGRTFLHDGAGKDQAPVVVEVLATNSPGRWRRSEAAQRAIASCPEAAGLVGKDRAAADSVRRSAGNGLATRNNYD